MTETSTRLRDCACLGIRSLCFELLPIQFLVGKVRWVPLTLASYFWDLYLHLPAYRLRFENNPARFLRRGLAKIEILPRSADVRLSTGEAKTKPTPDLLEPAGGWAKQASK